MAENKEFKCKKCGEKFKTKKGLNVHKSKAHGSSLSISIGNPWKMVSILSVVLLALSLVYTFTSECPEGVSGKITASEAGDKAVKFIKNLPQMQMAGVNVSLVNTEKTESGVYKVGIKLAAPQGDQELNSYITKDGKFLFPQGMDITQTQETAQEKQTQDQNNQQQQQTEELPKSKEPKVELYIFSYCPYGTQALDALIPVVELLQNKAEFEVKFFSNMHGSHELQQNKIQLCIQEKAPGKYWEYAKRYTGRIYKECGRSRSVSCDKGKSIALMEEVGIDSEEVMSCVESKGEELYQSNKKEASELNLRGSPSFVINGKYVQNIGRTPNGIKEKVCSAFKTEPEECSQKLGSSSGSAPSGGQC